MATRFRAWDDYYNPGTTVLRNKFTETDAATLSAKEEFAASARLDQIVAYGYYPSPGIVDAANYQYRMLARENHLVGLPRAQFVERLAEHWGELNTIHSFREGSTRSQFVFFSQLVENASYSIDSSDTINRWPKTPPARSPTHLFSPRKKASGHGNGHQQETDTHIATLRAGWLVTSALGSSSMNGTSDLPQRRPQSGGSSIVDTRWPMSPRSDTSVSVLIGRVSPAWTWTAGPRVACGR